MDSKQKESVLRLRRTDHKSEHLLVSVGRQGPKELDLKLTGTDKEVLYVGSVAECDLKSLQEGNFAGDVDEWRAILRFALWHQRPERTLAEVVRGVEAMGAISASTLTITLRRNIGGITQRLGSISLQQTEEEEVSTLDWVDVAAATSDELRHQVETLQSSLETQQEQIAQLSTELDMLVKAKKEHEHGLLSKFAALLNAKKSMIRDQQRLLNGAKIGPVAAEEISTARSCKISSKAGASRKSKRKATSAAASSPEEQGDQDDDDASPVDGTEDANGAWRSEPDTTEPSDADAATETEGEDDDALQKSATGPAASRRSTGGRSPGGAEPMDVEEDDTLPPPRRLPFNRQKTESKKHPEPAPPPDSKTNDVDEHAETDDEEL